MLYLSLVCDCVTGYIKTANSILLALDMSFD